MLSAKIVKIVQTVAIVKSVSNAIFVYTAAILCNVKIAQTQLIVYNALIARMAVIIVLVVSFVSIVKIALNV